MAYTSKTWSCGEKITADGLNNLESGVQEALECCGGGTEPLVVNVVDADPSSDGDAMRGELLREGQSKWLDKTWNEINSAFPNVYVVNRINENDFQAEIKFTVMLIYQRTYEGEETEYGIGIDSATDLITNDPNGYPNGTI